MDDETIEFDHIVSQTDLATLYSFDEEEVWIPKSQIESEEDYGDGSGCITIPHWLALEKELV